jgi:hypothetical protein
VREILYVENIDMAKENSDNQSEYSSAKTERKGTKMENAKIGENGGMERELKIIIGKMRSRDVGTKARASEGHTNSFWNFQHQN